jgi:hypothetical protein
MFDVKAKRKSLSNCSLRGKVLWAAEIAALGLLGRRAPEFPFTGPSWKTESQAGIWKPCFESFPRFISKCGWQMK